MNDLTVVQEMAPLWEKEGNSEEELSFGMENGQFFPIVALSETMIFEGDSISLPLDLSHRRLQEEGA